MLGWVLHVTHKGIWGINAVAGTSSPDVHVVSVTNISADFAGTACSFTLSGGVPGRYDNSTGRLTLDSSAPNPDDVSLVMSDAAGCGGHENGDVLTLSGIFEMDPATIDLTHSL
jgi:hypothetical protein